MGEPTFWGFAEDTAARAVNAIKSPILNTKLRGMHTLPSSSGGGTYPYTGEQTLGAYNAARIDANNALAFSNSIPLNGSSMAPAYGADGSIITGGYSAAPVFNLRTGQYEQINQSQAQANIPITSKYFGGNQKVTMSGGGTPATGNIGLTPSGFTEAGNMDELLGNTSSGSVSDLANIQTNAQMPLVKPEAVAAITGNNPADYNMGGLATTGSAASTLDSTALTVDQQQTGEKLAFDKEMAPWTKASQGMQIASSGLNALSGLYNAYMAHKTYELSKDSFEYNRSLSNVNLENQAKLVNQDLADRQAIRASRGGQSVDDFMANNSVRGRV